MVQTHDPWAQSQFGPWDIHLNKLGKEPYKIKHLSQVVVEGKEF